MGRKGVWAGKRREAAAGRAGEAASSLARSWPWEDTGCPGTLRTEPKTPGPAQQGEWPRCAEGRHPAALAMGKARSSAINHLSGKWAENFLFEGGKKEKKFCIWSDYTGIPIKHAAFKLNFRPLRSAAFHWQSSYVSGLSGHLLHWCLFQQFLYLKLI